MKKNWGLWELWRPDKRTGDKLGATDWDFFFENGNKSRGVVNAVSKKQKLALQVKRWTQELEDGSNTEESNTVRSMENFSNVELEDYDIPRKTLNYRILNKVNEQQRIRNADAEGNMTETE